MLMCQNLPAYYSVVGGEPFLSEFVSIAQQLVEDPATNVRKVLAETLIEVAVRCSTENSAKSVMDLIMKMMEVQ